METALHVIGTTAVVAVWLAPAFLLAICATCEGCTRVLSHLHRSTHVGEIPPHAPSH